MAGGGGGDAYPTTPWILPCTDAVGRCPPHDPLDPPLHRCGGEMPTPRPPGSSPAQMRWGDAHPTIPWILPCTDAVGRCPPHDPLDPPLHRCGGEMPTPRPPGSSPAQMRWGDAHPTTPWILPCTDAVGRCPPHDPLDPPLHRCGGEMPTPRPPGSSPAQMRWGDAHPTTPWILPCTDAVGRCPPHDPLDPPLHRCGGEMPTPRPPGSSPAQMRWGDAHFTTPWILPCTDAVGRCPPHNPLDPPLHRCGGEMPTPRPPGSSPAQMRWGDAHPTTSWILPCTDAVGRCPPHDPLDPPLHRCGGEMPTPQPPGSSPAQMQCNYASKARIQ